MTGAEVAIALGVGLVAGTAAGLLGVGGGFLMVPAMVVLLDQPQHLAQGTSLLVIVPTSLAGTVANVRRRNADTSLLVRLGAAGIAGAVLGALGSLQISAEVLRRIFGVLLILVAARLLIPRRVREP